MPNPILLLIPLVVLLIWWRWRLSHRSPQQLARIRAALDGGAKLIDVRTRAEFDSGHPKGAINIPLDELQRRLDELAERSAPVVLCCATGMRSRAAARMLEREGFAEVLDLGPGRSFG